MATGEVLDPAEGQHQETWRATEGRGLSQVPQQQFEPRAGGSIILAVQRLSVTVRHTAASSVSPVRMRMTCSTVVTNILPSPILPVRAAFTIASIA